MSLLSREERNEWIEQAKDTLLLNAKHEDNVNKELMYLYDETAYELENNINALFSKFAQDNKLTPTQANHLLSGEEYSIWRKSIEKYLADSGNTPANSKTLLELNTLAMKSRISRQEQLLSKVYRNMAALAKDSEASLTKLLSDIMRTNYYRASFDLQKSLGIQFSVAKINEKLIKDVLEYPWSQKKFSVAIWDNVDKLTAIAKREIVRGIANGSGSLKIAKNISELMGKGKYVAERLARTECHYFAYQGKISSYRELGIMKYRFLGGNEGGHCCCSELNGQEFLLEYAEANINLPPIHPNCKCTIIPVASRSMFSDRKTEVFDKSVSFNDWAKHNVREPSTGTINIDPILITKQSVKSVKPVKSSILSPKAQKQFAKKHKELLEYIKEDPIGTEAIAYYDMELNELAKYKGKIGHVDGRLVAGNHIVIHNHPSGNIFTHTDIHTFIENFNTQIMSVVGNNGKVYTLEKTDNYDGFKLAMNLSPIIEKFERGEYNDNIEKYLNEVQTFLRGADKYGTKFNG